MMALVYSPKYLEHETSNHPESPDRLTKIMEGLDEADLLQSLPFFKPYMAKEEDLERVHTAEHVEKIRTFCERGGGYLDFDTYASPQSYEIAKLAAGGAIKASELVLNGFNIAYALVRPPGHHATRERSMGFCLFNNLAVALEHARKVRKIRKFVILDFDVHYGNGTAHIFYNDPDVLYISIHQDPHTIFPSEGFLEDMGEDEGKGSNLNIPLSPGSGTSDYIYILERILRPVFKDFNADFYFFDVGFDAHRDDPLSSMRLDDDFYEWMAMEILNQSRPRVLTLEGGYDLEALKRCNLKMINVLKEERVEHSQISPEMSEVREDTKNICQRIEDNFSPFFTF
jgi:acetoin utilization deacetylase AcuC-like enzyme